MNNEQLNIDKLLDITDLPGLTGEDVQVYEPLALVEVKSNPKDRSPDLEDDYTIVRKNMHFQQQMLMDAAKIFLETAKNADSPKHMIAFSTLMGQMATTNKELLKLHKEMKEITSEPVKTSDKKPSSNMNIEKATVFVGSPSDMMDEYGDAYEAQENREKIIDGTTT